jgi:4-diphosphocytidyl-2-C-methyl-D-erythritol kinase
VPKALALYSPAKINLFLRILSRRPDGFHSLASLMQAVGLFDNLTLSVSDQDFFSSDHPDLPLDDNNLIIKALTLFRSKTGVHTPLSIHLEKRIPMQAGLGGGSGNVATALWGLNQLFQTRLSEDLLRTWAGEISSDAPFFFSSGRAFCTGIGEIVESYCPEDAKTLWLVKPQEGLSTPEIFANLDLKQCSSVSPKYLLWQHIYGEGKPCNDLEQVAFQLNPALQKLKLFLEEQHLGKVWMTGSGTGFVTTFEPKNVPDGTLLFPLPLISREKSWYQPSFLSHQSAIPEK